MMKLWWAGSLAAGLGLAASAVFAQPMSSQPGWMSCSDLGWARSSDVGQPVHLTVTNGADGPRPLYWVDGNGTQVSMGWLEQNASLSFNTNTSHVWLVTDPPGNCLEMFGPMPGQTRYRVTVPGQFFGDE